jgi:hypothetical protein
MGAVLTDLRWSESAEIAGIYYDLDATTRLNKVSNINGRQQTANSKQPAVGK